MKNNRVILLKPGENIRNDTQIYVNDTLKFINVNVLLKVIWLMNY